MGDIRIVLADDHTLVRHGLRLMLEREPGMKVVGEASNGREALQVVETASPHVIIMDLGMPTLNGIEAARQIHLKHSATCIVILSMHSDETYVLRALQAGARAYLLKDCADTDLINAIKAVLEGKAFFSPAISRVLVEDYVRQLQEKGVQDSYELLTSREREILQLIGEGNSNKEVAQKLNLSPYTVETHRSNLMEKLNLHSIPDLILYAVRKGVVS